MALTRCIHAWAMGHGQTQVGPSVSTGHSWGVCSCSEVSLACWAPGTCLTKGRSKHLGPAFLPAPFQVLLGPVCLVTSPQVSSWIPQDLLCGDRGSLSPYCLSKSQASHPNLASVAHQALMTAGPAFPWDTARRPLPVSSPPLCMAWCFSLSICLSPHCCFLCTCQGPTRR